MTEYSIIRSNRKTLAIHITRNAAVEVRAPLNLAQSDIERFVQTKEDWITTHLAIQTERSAEKSAFMLNYGNSIAVMGRRCIITARTGNRVSIEDDRFYMPPSLSSDQIKSACIKMYKLIAKNELPRRTAAYAARMGVTPAAVKINSATTRWGSCSGRNNINFSWRLIMAADEIIDYVVVHELAHIIEHNHSARFWTVVERILPDYKARQKQLKVLQAVLTTENWE